MEFSEISNSKTGIVLFNEQSTQSILFTKAYKFDFTKGVPKGSI